MATKPRIVAPNLIYEVTSKGARNTNIFSSSELKLFFLKELEITLKLFSCQCFAWSIMDDHYHLVLMSGEIPISNFMQRLNSVFAKHFNKVKNEVGVVFLKRFASLIVEKSNLKELVRYVHLNPVRCGNCTIDQLNSYQWCGHRVLLNNDSGHFQNTVDVLELFLGTIPSEVYADYVRSGLSKEENNTLVKNVRNANRGIENFYKSEPWVLGCEKFVKETLENDRCRRLRIARHIRENISFEIIHEKVATKLNILKTELYRQGRSNSRAHARNLFAFIGKLHFEFTGVSISNYLGVSSSAISKMITRCENIDYHYKDEIIEMIFKSTRAIENNFISALL